MRLAASNEYGIDHTGEIISFTDIGTGAGAANVPPRPWGCYTTGDTNNVEWQFPGGTAVPAVVAPATGDYLYIRRPSADARVVLYRGPTHNSPDGEHCCVRTTTNERRCVTFSEC